ncbi:MAG: ABC transporter substrate-binding protein [Oscillospiraceae bacterium]|jgi:iron complex transport system substrate-binding protein|nr:ABC transporter substrate-binding protein [Oscillospiraceae bacterium]
MKKLFALMLVAFLIAALAAGCDKSATPPESTLPDQPTASAPLDESTPPVSAAGPADASSPVESATYLFTDSCGREVELPRDVTRIAPSGPLAQIVLFTLCPDKLVGFASDISDEQFEYIDKKYAALPVFGNFYADTLNLESVMVAAPQIVIDIGEIKPNIADDMAGIQEKTGIPTIFVHMELDSMLSAYETLGMVTGETEQASQIIEYIDKTLTETAQKANSIPDADRLSVYYGQDDGLTVVISGTVHSDVIGIVGGINVANVEESIRGGASIVSMEQIMLWNPDIVLFAPASIYGDVASLAEWKELNPIKAGAFYEIPNGPYNWMGRPPSVNRILGVKWLSNLLYPDIFKYDMKAETREFYRLFYHCDVTDAQVDSLLAKSTFKH